jgi:tRNA(Arg) A34 adenosine deaminase TadA
MREALTLAARGFDEDQMPIGAVATLGDDILAGAYWRYDARGLLDDPEAVVLRRAEKEHDLRSVGATSRCTRLSSRACFAWRPPCRSSQGASSTRSRCRTTVRPT